MKKFLAVLLAVLMVGCMLPLGAAAEGDDGETGTVYLPMENPLPRISASTEGEVVILQAGDVIRFGTVTVNTSSKKNILEVRYYPDAASLRAKEIVNKDWAENKVQQYNLDSTKWELKKGQTTDDLMAKSPNYYKSFYTTSSFEKGDTAEVTITGMNAEAIFTRDSAGVDRGEAPIDFKLEGAKFIGWALYKYNWANKTGTYSVDVYALWDRDAAPEPVEPEKPVDPGEPVVYDTPIQAAYAKFMAKYEEIVGMIQLLPATINTALPNWLNGVVRDWLYKVFKIDA